MRIDAALNDRLTALVADEGLELVATEVVGSGAKTIVRLIVDGPDGVKLDQCASVSRQASAMLDVDDLIQHRYTLEVSSPGLDRKLYSENDYARFAGRQLRLRMQPGFREHRNVLGELIGLDDGVVSVAVADGTVVELPLDQVFEARLEVDWRSMMKKGKDRP